MYSRPRHSAVNQADVKCVIFFSTDIKKQHTSQKNISFPSNTSENGDRRVCPQNLYLHYLYTDAGTEAHNQIQTQAASLHEQKTGISLVLFGSDLAER